MPTLTSSLNAEQARAVQHGEGPLLVLAGAGSGKTRVLTHRIAHLIRVQGAEPRSVLAVTFTNKAAQEMKERAEELLGGWIPGLWIGTFHSICLRILRSHAEAAGFRPGLTVFDRDDQLAVVRRILKEEDLGESHQARDVIGQISRWKNAMQSPDALMGGDPRLARIGRVWGLYGESLRRQNGVDFDDILVETLLLLKRNETLRAAYRDRFRHVLIDEYQDTNAVQFRLVEALAGPEGDVFVVGDDDQSIYGWRGADIRNILDFEETFPGAGVVRLEENYRSTESILDVAHAVVSRNRGRKPKKLWTSRTGGESVRFTLFRDEEEEARGAVEEIARGLETGEIEPRDVAVLYRTHAQSRPLEDACLAYRVPYVVLGAVTFYQRREIKDLLAYLRVAVNPDDEVSLRRSVSVPKRGIGEKTVESWLAAARAAGAAPADFAAREGDLPFRGAAARALREWALLIRDLRSGAGGDPAAVIEELVDRIGYRAHLEADPDHEDRLANVDELIAGAASFTQRSPEGTLEAYVGELSLLSQVDAARIGGAAIHLMTVHNAKGLEFRHVYVTGLEEGLFPHMSAYRDDEELEEERRLFYVACTRAMDRLRLSAARDRRRTNRVFDGGVSRFLGEIPDHLIETVSFSGEGSASPRGASTARERFAGWDEEDEVITYDDPLVGHLVLHPTFGKGLVLHVDGAGDAARVTVRFPRTGPKKVIRSYLRVVEGDGP